MRIKKRIIAGLTLIACAALCLGGCAATNGNGENGDGSGESTAERDVLYAEKPSYDGLDLSRYIRLGKYIGLEIPYISTEVTEESVSERIAEIAEQDAVMVNVTDRAIRTGDTVYISYTGTVNGVPFAGGSADNRSVTVGGDDAPYHGMDTMLLGEYGGETVKFELTLPEDADSKSAGKTAVFTVRILRVTESRVPEQNDAFAQTHGYRDLADMRRGVREELLQENEKKAETGHADALWKLVTDGCEVLAYPEDIVEQYCEEQYRYFEEYAAAAGISMSRLTEESYSMDTDAFRERCRKFARDAVRDEMALYAIAQAEGIEISDEEYADGVTDYCQRLDCTEDALLGRYGGKEGVRRSLLWEKTLAYLTERAVVAEDTAA